MFLLLDFYYFMLALPLVYQHTILTNNDNYWKRNYFFILFGIFTLEQDFNHNMAAFEDV